MQEQTDRELVTLARAGNKEAFSELLARYQPMALRIAHGMVRQEAPWPAVSGFVTFAPCVVGPYTTLIRAGRAAMERTQTRMIRGDQ